MVKHKRSGKVGATRSGRKTHKARKASGRARKITKHSLSRGAKRSKARASRPVRAARRAGQPLAPSDFKKAADEVPTLEQVTITCANCGRLFKVLKLKGLSLEGTICQRCSLGEMELPESFG